jgi:hypothetical protein
VREREAGQKEKEREEEDKAGLRSGRLQNRNGLDQCTFFDPIDCVSGPTLAGASLQRCKPGSRWYRLRALALFTATMVKQQYCVRQYTIPFIPTTLIVHWVPCWLCPPHSGTCLDGGSVDCALSCARCSISAVDLASDVALISDDVATLAAR